MGRKHVNYSSRRFFFIARQISQIGVLLRASLNFLSFGPERVVRARSRWRRRITLHGASHSLSDTVNIHHLVTCPFASLSWCILHYLSIIANYYLQLNLFHFSFISDSSCLVAFYSFIVIHRFLFIVDINIHEICDFVHGAISIGVVSYNSICINMNWHASVWIDVNCYDLTCIGLDRCALS